MENNPTTTFATNVIETISTFTWNAAKGRRVRKATLVTFRDGYEVRFLELQPKRIAASMAREIELKRNRARKETK